MTNSSRAADLATSEQAMSQAPLTSSTKRWRAKGPLVDVDNSRRSPIGHLLGGAPGRRRSQDQSIPVTSAGRNWVGSVRHTYSAVA